MALGIAQDHHLQVMPWTWEPVPHPPHRTRGPTCGMAVLFERQLLGVHPPGRREPQGVGDGLARQHPLVTTTSAEGSLD